MAQYPASSFNSKFPVTKSNTAGQASLGGASISGANGTSAWAQVTASLSSDTLVTQVYVTSNAAGSAASNAYYLELGIGGAGAEVSIDTLYFTPSSVATAWQAVVNLAVLQRIASGQRLAARVTNSGLSGANIIATVVGVPYANTEGN